MDKCKAQELHNELETILKEFATKNELKSPDFSALRFTDSTFSFKCEFGEEGSLSKFEEAANTMIKIHGLKKVAPNGDEIVEYHSRKSKFPFIVRHKKDGKMYKYTTEMTKQVFAA